MSAGHTPGRLVVSSQDDYPTGAAQFDGVTANADLFVLYHDNAKADARRLVACWNACDGLETDLLENIVLTGDTLAGRFTAREIAHEIEERELRSQNADMLAALIVAREFVSTDRNSFADCALPPHGPMDPDDAAAVADYDAALLQIDAAIQKATPPTTGATA